MKHIVNGLIVAAPGLLGAGLLAGHVWCEHPCLRWTALAALAFTFAAGCCAGTGWLSSVVDDEEEARARCIVAAAEEALERRARGEPELNGRAR